MLTAVVMSLLGFFFWLVVARFYTETEVGFSSAIISAINFLTLLSMLGLNSSLTRFLPHAKKPRELVNSCLTLSGLISLVLAGIFIAGSGVWSPAMVFIRQNAILSSAFVIFTLLWTLSSLIDATFVAKRRASFVLSKNTIFSVLKIPLPLLFVSFFHAFGIVASWGIAVAVAVALSLFLFLPKVQNRYKPALIVDLNPLRAMWRYSGGSYLANLLSSAPALLLPLMVVNLLGAESNAYFYVAWMIAALLIAIPGGVSWSLFAEGSHFEEKLRENVIKSFKFTFAVLVPGVIVAVVAGKWLLLAFGQSYAINALHLLQILAISSLPLGANSIYTSILRVTGRIKELVVIWAAITVAVLLVSGLIMSTTGIIGVGYAWLGIQVAVAIYILSTRKLI
ncbi:oligosaccharide flippase family protein [Chloroflexota bacterium]